MNESLETPEQKAFAEWLLHPVTKKLRLEARRRIDALRDKWQNGELLDQFQAALVIENAIAIGNCQSLSWLEGLEAEDLEEGK